MRAPSSKWFEEIARVRDGSDGADRSVPLFPWLAPPLARSVRDVIERWGVVRHLRAGDPVLGGQSDRVDKVVLVKSGITVRHFGSQKNPRKPLISIRGGIGWKNAPRHSKNRVH